MSDEAGTISREAAAKLLKITERHLTRLVSDGWIQKSAGDKYTLVGTIHGYIAYRDDQQERANKTAGARKKDDARTREIELRIAERERRLISLDEVQAAYDMVIGAMRAEIDGLPARMRRDKALREEIQKLLDGILVRTTDRIRESMEAHRTGRSDPAAAEEDAA